MQWVSTTSSYPLSTTAAYLDNGSWLVRPSTAPLALPYTPTIPTQSSTLPVSSLPNPNGFLQSIGPFLQSAKAGFSTATQAFLTAKQATVDFFINDPFPAPMKTVMNVAGLALQAASGGAKGAIAVANFSSGVYALQNIPGSALEQAFYFAGAAKGFTSLLPTNDPNLNLASWATLAAQAAWTYGVGANPVTFLVSLDATLAGIIGGQLQQLAKDPPTNDYQSV